MENASKALIIAGAILLSILLIGLGMGVYNNASSTMGKADLSTTEVAAHNATFESYEGRIKGSQAKALLNAINKNNTNFADRQIEVDLDGETLVEADTEGVVPEITDITDVKTSTTYDVSFEYNGNDGLISKCIINIYGKTYTPPSGT